MPPAIVNVRCRAIHEVLVQEGWVGKPIKRQHFDSMLMRFAAPGVGLSSHHARVYVATGRGLGLWELREHVGRRESMIVILPPQPAPKTSAPQASS